MTIYTCKKTGKKFTKQELQAHRQLMAKRRARTLSSLIVIGLFLVFTLGLKIGSHAFENQFMNMPTVDIRIQPGQTVWGIAEELAPTHSTRDVVYAMKSVNEGVNLEEPKAYSDVITFYVDSEVDLSTLDHLVFETCTKQ